VAGEREHAMSPGVPTGQAGRAPLVSVVVPVRDNPAGVAALVRRLEAQTLGVDRFEVVIADDGSSERLERPEVDRPHVRVVRGPRRTSYAARNRGAAAAGGTVLAFCDSDCLPDPEWLAAGLAALEDADIVAGEVMPIAPSRPTLWSILSADMFLDQRRNVTRSRAATANLLVRRRDFEAWGGFDPALLSGGDFEFVLRAVGRGARLAYAPEVLVTHPTLDGGRAFLRKVWRTNRWAAVHRSRAGYRVGPWHALTLVPVLGVALTRRDALRAAARLDRARLRAAGLDPSAWDELRGLAMLYTLVGALATLARLSGWVASRAGGRGARETPRPALDDVAPG
jgi:GT2 family glycosyltransferase